MDIGKLQGAMEMLIEAKKQFRLNGQHGHADMCCLHAERLRCEIEFATVLAQFEDTDLAGDKL